MNSGISATKKIPLIAKMLWDEGPIKGRLKDACYTGSYGSYGPFVRGRQVPRPFLENIFSGAYI